MREILDGSMPDAVLFDLDGTLYRQASVRRAMAARLLRHHAASPLVGYRVAKLLAAYRWAHEELRAQQFAGDITTRQLELAAARAGCEPADIRTHVERWMEDSPLSVIARHRRTDVVALITELADRGVVMGVVSDYPASAKLAALGLIDRFAVVVSAQDPRVGALKPDPRGLLAALDCLGAAPHRSWYVGDRLDVDQPAASAAGMSFAHVDRGVLTTQHRTTSPTSMGRPQ